MKGSSFLPLLSSCSYSGFGASQFPETKGRSFRVCPHVSNVINETWGRIQKVRPHVSNFCVKFLRQSAVFSQGWLLQLSGDKTLIQKKILNADILNAIFIPPRFHIVFHDNDFLERVRDSDQGRNLLFLLFRIING